MTSNESETGPVERASGGTMSLIWGRPFPFAAEENADAAPGARPRSADVPPWTLRRAWQNGVWVFVVGLSFLVFFLVPLLADPPPRPLLAAALGLTVLLCLAYAGTALAVDLPLAGRVVYAAAFLALLCGGFFPFVGSYVVAMTPYAAVMIAYLLPWRLARIVLPLGLLAGVAGSVAAQNWVAMTFAVVGAGMGFFIAMGMETRRIQGRLRRAEHRIATLAVAAERERIARDLHDILGHSLTAVAVKAGLAARLSEVDVGTARAEMVEVERIARQALADVRATAAGFRQVRLATEVASARSVLEAAGIACEVPAALEPMPDEISELFGYVVREAVTNVIRHAHASRVVITASAASVTVTDDGVGAVSRSDDPGSGSGSGLIGLGLRAEQCGAVLRAEPGTPTGTVLTVALATRTNQGRRAVRA